MGDGVKRRLTRLVRRIRGALTRRRRIALDLLLALLIAGGTWAACGYPLPGELAFRRLEGQNLLEPGEIVFHQRGSLSTGGAMGIGRLTREIFISLGEDWAAVGYLTNRGEYAYWKPIGPNHYTVVEVQGSWMELWTLEPGPAVIPLLFPVRGPEGEGRDMLGWGAAALRLPAGTAGGRLSLTDRAGEVHTLDGLLQGEGTLWFWEADRTFREEGYYSTDNRTVLGDPWMPGLDYTLELYGPAGETLARLTGNVVQERGSEL